MLLGFIPFLWLINNLLFGYKATPLFVFYTGLDDLEVSSNDS